jgi:NAD+ kinase
MQSKELALRSVGVLYNNHIPQALSLAEEVGAWLEEQGKDVHICTMDVASNIFCLRDANLLVTLGGDGSLLQAARLAAPYGVMLLGINFGRVGFLTETEPEPDDWKETLSKALDGDYWVEERLMLRVATQRGGGTFDQADALNDVVVGRGARNRVVQLGVKVDGGELATYVADGLIVATPTGSTAYALAAGGPILPPQLRNLLLVPVAPHLSMDRSIVLAEGVSVEITVLGGRTCMLTVDGQVGAELEIDDVVTVEASPYRARFARVREQAYFYKTLVSRLAPRNGK